MKGVDVSVMTAAFASPLTESRMTNHLMQGNPVYSSALRMASSLVEMADTLSGTFAGESSATPNCAMKIAAMMPLNMKCADLPISALLL